MFTLVRMENERLLLTGRRGLLLCLLSAMNVHPANHKDLIIGRLNQPENMGGSCMYMCPQDLTPTHEWYKPNELELKQMEKLMGNGWPSMKQHLDMGGLAYRKIETT